MTRIGWLLAGAAGAAFIALVVFRQDVFDMASSDKQLASYSCVDFDTCAGEVKKSMAKVPDEMKADCRRAHTAVLLKLGQNYPDAQENQGRCRVTGAWEVHPGDENRVFGVAIWIRW